MTQPSSAAAGTAERLAGAALGRVFAAATVMRRSKPIHNRGQVFDAEITRFGSGAQTLGVPYLDDPGTDHGLVRLSRSVGLPPPVPDVLGFALRFADDTGTHDLLLATTGLRPGLRHLLVPRLDARAASYGSLVTYRAGDRRVLFSAVPAADGDSGPSFCLRIATVRGPWHDFALARLAAHASGGGTADDDEPLAFDPIRHPLPGLSMAPAISRLREPAYRFSQRARGRVGRG